MANITYRASLTPPAAGSTTLKSFPLTNLEVDANFKALNDEIATLPTEAEVIVIVNSSVSSITGSYDSNAMAYAIALG